MEHISDAAIVWIVWKYASGRWPLCSIQLVGIPDMIGVPDGCTISLSCGLMGLHISSFLKLRGTVSQIMSKEDIIHSSSYPFLFKGAHCLCPIQWGGSTRLHVMAEWFRCRTPDSRLYVTLWHGVRIPVLPRVICGVALSRQLNSGGWLQST